MNQTQLANLAAAGCPVPKIPGSRFYVYFKPPVQDVMEWLAQKTGGCVTLRADGKWYTCRLKWRTNPRRPSIIDSAPRNRDPLDALYALAVAVGAVAE